MTIDRIRRRRLWVLPVMALLSLSAIVLGMGRRTARPAPTPDDALPSWARRPDTPDAQRAIDWVAATSIGVSIRLTAEGIAMGRTREGARGIVTMASDSYSQFPPEDRLRDDLLWAHDSIAREVVGHAWASTFGIDNGNPVDIHFGDHVPDTRTMQGAIWRGPLGLWIDVAGWMAGRMPVPGYRQTMRRSA